MEKFDRAQHIAIRAAQPLLGRACIRRGAKRCELQTVAARRYRHRLRFRLFAGDRRLRLRRRRYCRPRHDIGGPGSTMAAAATRRPPVSVAARRCRLARFGSAVCGGPDTAGCGTSRSGRRGRRRRRLGDRLRQRLFRRRQDILHPRRRPAAVEGERVDIGDLHAARIRSAFLASAADRPPAPARPNRPCSGRAETPKPTPRPRSPGTDPPRCQRASAGGATGVLKIGRRRTIR